MTIHLHCFVGYILYCDRFDNVLSKRYFSKVQGGFSIVRNHNQGRLHNWAVHFKVQGVVDTE